VLFPTEVTAPVQYGARIKAVAQYQLREFGSNYGVQVSLTGVLKVMVKLVSVCCQAWNTFAKYFKAVHRLYSR